MILSWTMQLSGYRGYQQQRTLAQDLQSNYRREELQGDCMPYSLPRSFRTFVFWRYDYVRSINSIGVNFTHNVLQPDFTQKPSCDSRILRNSLLNCFGYKNTARLGY